LRKINAGFLLFLVAVCEIGGERDRTACEILVVAPRNSGVGISCPTPSSPNFPFDRTNSLQYVR
jgi:hypothetical protein